MSMKIVSNESDSSVVQEQIVEVERNARRNTCCFCYLMVMQVVILAVFGLVVFISVVDLAPVSDNKDPRSAYEDMVIIPWQRLDFCSNNAEAPSFKGAFSFDGAAFAIGSSYNHSWNHTNFYALADFSGPHCKMTYDQDMPANSSFKDVDFCNDFGSACKRGGILNIIFVIICLAGSLFLCSVHFLRILKDSKLLWQGSVLGQLGLLFVSTFAYTLYEEACVSAFKTRLKHQYGNLGKIKISSGSPRILVLLVMFAIFFQFFISHSFTKYGDTSSVCSVLMSYWRSISAYTKRCIGDTGCCRYKCYPCWLLLRSCCCCCNCRGGIREMVLLGQDPCAENTEFSPTYFEKFKGEQKEGEFYQAHNTRPIDVVCELVNMLNKAKVYGHPGTDGTFTSNILAWIKNDNDIWSMFQLNAASPKNKGRRILFFYVFFSLNYSINTTAMALLNLEFIESHPILHYVPPLVASVVLLLFKQVVEYVFRSPWSIKNLHASELLDPTTIPDDTVIEHTRLRNKRIRGIDYILSSIPTILTCFGLIKTTGAFHYDRYMVTLLLNSVVFALLGAALQVGMGRYNRDKEKFQRKWGALSYEGKFVHPKSITDVAAALVKHNGGPANCLRYLDTQSRCNWNHYFCLEGKGEDQLVWDLIRVFVDATPGCVSTGGRLDADFLSRFNGVDKFDPYDISTKMKSYPGINMEASRPVDNNSIESGSNGVITSQPTAPTTTIEDNKSPVLANEGEPESDETFRPSVGHTPNRAPTAMAQQKETHNVTSPLHGGSAEFDKL